MSFCTRIILKEISINKNGILKIKQPADSIFGSAGCFAHYYFNKMGLLFLKRVIKLCRKMCWYLRNGKEGLKNMLKKFMCVFICFAFALTSVSAALPSENEDFEKYEPGEKVVIFNSGESKNGASFEVVKDPLDEENKVLKITNDSSADRYMSINGDFSDRTIIRFKIYCPESGEFSIYFRDSVSTDNNMTLFKLKNDQISCAGTVQKYDRSKWISVKIVINMSEDYIDYYSNIDSDYNGEKLVAETSFSKLFGTRFENHTKENTNMRFGLMKSTGEAYLDDFGVAGDYSLLSGMFVSPVRAYKNIDGTDYEISSLRGGALSFSTDITNMEEEAKTASAVFALYDKNGKLKNCSVSENALIEYGQTVTLRANMNVTTPDEGDLVKTFIVEDLNNIKPLAQVFEFETGNTYERPLAAEILDDAYKNHPDETSHPRVVRTKSDFDKLRGYVETDENYALWFEQIKKNASSALTAALPTYTYDVRNTILSQSRLAMNNILTLAFMYQMTGDDTYAEGVWRFAGVVCDKEKFPDWNAQHHYLDTGEMGFAVALAYDWCYDYWTDERKQIMETALYDNIVSISLGVFEGKYGYSGLKAATNWNPVCNGGSICAAAAIFHKYPKEASRLIAYSTTALESCLTDYAPLGGYSESPTYWTYGTTYLMWCISTLDSLCGKDYSISKAPGIKTTGYFPAYISGPCGNWNYHDGGTGYLDTSLSNFFAAKFDDKNLAGMRYNILKNGMYTKSINPDCKDLLFYNPDLINDNFSLDDLDLDFYYPKIETAVMRKSFIDRNSMFTGLHGGYNSANHGDLDAGSFILDVDGERIIDELGSDNYALASYFNSGASGKRWQYYKKNAEGQNSIMIADDSSVEHGQNPVARVEINRFETNKSGAIAVADMLPALGSKVESAKRGVMLCNDRTQTVVQDEIRFTSPTELYWLAHTKGKIEISADGKSAVITKGKVSVCAKLISDDDSLVFESAPEKPFLDTTYTGDGENSRTNFTKLYIHAKDVTSFNTSVVFYQISGDGADCGYEKIPIDSWTVED